MRETLEALASGNITVAEAEAALAGYATGEAGRFDAARRERRGVPEVVFGQGKTPDEVASLIATSVETTGHGMATRVEDDHVAAVRTRLDDDAPDATVEHDERCRVVVVHAQTYEPPQLDAVVGIVTGGTSDRGPAGEAAAIAREMGADVRQFEDVGVASLVRLLDVLEEVREADVLIVAAGREGSLPTVVAGLVGAPVIGLPVSTGYGHAGKGEAALASTLQSCTVLTTVNIDAGFVAGAQAGLIAQSVSTARTG